MIDYYVENHSASLLFEKTVFLIYTLKETKGNSHSSVKLLLIADLRYKVNKDNNTIIHISMVSL